MNCVLALDIKDNLKKIVHKLKMSHINLDHIVCFRSYGSTSRARARIWSFPKIWQQALNLPPHYIIEVLSEKYDHLSKEDKERVLIHELMHIPKNFSGSLLAHKRKSFRINNQTVEKLFNLFKRRS